MFGMCSVCDPPKIFLMYKISYLLFSNPNHKTKTVRLQLGERLGPRRIDPHIGIMVTLNPETI
jgi:hypothetical protein